MIRQVTVFRAFGHTFPDGRQVYITSDNAEEELPNLPEEVVNFRIEQGHLRVDELLEPGDVAQRQKEQLEGQDSQPVEETTGLGRVRGQASSHSRARGTAQE